MTMALFSCHSLEGRYFSDVSSIRLLHSEEELTALLNDSHTKCRIILSGTAGPALSNILVELSGRGIELEILMNLKYKGIVYAEAAMYYGNQNSAIYEDIFLIDEQGICLAGNDSRTLSPPFVWLSDRGLSDQLHHEFEQMAYLHRFAKGNDSEIPKLPETGFLEYRFPDGSVKLGFHPQDNVLNTLYRSLENFTGRSALILNSGGDTRLLALLDHLYPQGPPTEVVLWDDPDRSEDICSYYPWLNHFMTKRPGFNALFLGEGDSLDRVLLWSFPLDTRHRYNLMDGLLLDIEGSFVQELYQFYSNQYLQSQYQEDRFKHRVSFPDAGQVVFSEVGFMNISGDWRGDFIELANVSQSALELGGCRIILSNAYRPASPDSLSFPLGTILLPGQCLVIASSYQEYSYVDFVADLFIYSGGFSLSLLSREGGVIDCAADVELPYEAWGARVYSSSRDKSMHRLDAFTPGNEPAAWTGTTLQTNVYPLYSSEIRASPGYYTP